MAEENISHQLRLKKKDEARNNVIKEIKQNELISEKQKKVCKTSNYIEYLLIFISQRTHHIESMSI